MTRILIVLAMISSFSVIVTALIIPGLFFGRGMMGAMAVLALFALMAQDYRDGWIVMRACRDSLQRYKYPVALIALSAIPGILGSYDIAESTQTVLRSLFFGGFALLVCHWFSGRPKQQSHKFTMTMAIGLVVTACIGFYTLYDPEPFARLMGHWDADRNMPKKSPYLLVKHATYAMGIILPFFVWLGFLGDRKYLIPTLTATAVTVVFADQTHNISIVIGLGLALLTFILITGIRYLRSVGARFAVLSALSLMIVGGGMAAINKLTPDTLPEEAVLGLAEPVVDYHRQHIWLYVWDMGWQKPLTGWGINALNKVPETDIVEPVFNQPRVPGHPHNFLLEIFAEAGLLGFLPLIGLFLYWLIRQLKALCLDDRQILAPVTLTTVAAILPPAFVAYSIWSPWWMLSIFMTIGLAAALDARRRSGLEI